MLMWEDDFDDLAPRPVVEMLNMRIGKPQAAVILKTWESNPSKRQIGASVFTALMSNFTEQSQTLMLNTS